MKEFLCLNDIKPGNRARVKELTSTGSIRRRLLDIGLVENTEVECLGQSPLGDPCAYIIRGAVIALRSEDSGRVMVYRKESEHQGAREGKEQRAESPDMALAADTASICEGKAGQEETEDVLWG